MSEISNEQVVERCQDIVDRFIKTERLEREKYIEKIIKSNDKFKNQKVVDYVILCDTYCHHLSDAVKNQLSLGYTPFGSIFTRKVDKENFVYQAMIKFED